MSTKETKLEVLYKMIDNIERDKHVNDKIQYFCPVEEEWVNFDTSVMDILEVRIDPYIRDGDLTLTVNGVPITEYGYATYDSCIVVAKDEESARLMHPDDYGCDVWCKPEEVKVKLIGTTETEEEGSVIIPSFNAG